jgi:hypothetical protein
MIGVAGDAFQQKQTKISKPHPGNHPVVTIDFAGF